MQDLVLSEVWDFKRLEELRETWTRLCLHPNADLDFYISICKGMAEVRAPYVLVAKRGEVIQSILVGRLEVMEIHRNVGYATVFRTRAKRISFIYGGMLGAVDPDTIMLFVRRIGKALRTHADVVFMNHLQIGSPLHSAIILDRRWVLVDTARSGVRHWRLRLPQTYDMYLSRFSAKKRHELRRLPRALEKAFEGKIEYQINPFKGPIASLVATLESVAAKTYQRGLGTGFLGSSVDVARLQLESDRGRLYTAVMSIEHQPCAFWIGTLYQGSLYLEYTGYDASYARFQPGTVLLLRLVQHLCSAGGVQFLDFGFGDALYKQQLCTENTREASLCRYALTPMGIRLNVERAVAATISSVLRAAAGGALAQRVKTQWRNSARSRLRNKPMHHIW